MKLKYSVIYLAIVAVISGCSKVTVPQMDLLGDVTSDVAILASDNFEGRETGTEGEEKAAAYIIKRYQDIGLEPKGDYGTFTQGYQRVIKSNPHADEPTPDDPIIKGNNVVGYIDNQAKQTVIIGAHYDHLGYGAEGSLYTGPAEIHNGADDNASGVAGMLYLARMLKNNSKAEHYNYLFIGFSGEEKGLWGSNYFANNPTINLNKVAFMINMDMVGRLKSDNTLAVGGVGTSPSWNKLLDKYNKNFTLIKSDSGIGPSDHTSFYLKDIPVLFFFTGQHEDYHKPTDDLHKVNFQGIEKISNLIYKLIIGSKKEAPLEFTKTKDEQDATPAFNVTLGVMPDYLYDGKGMRIDGVREGKTAFKHDFLQGDIVLKMGDIEVVDMKTYMNALSKYHPGDTIDIIIKREGKELIKKVTF